MRYHLDNIKSASAGASAIIKKLRCVRKCVRNDFQGADVRAQHTKIHRNPTSAENRIVLESMMFNYDFSFFIMFSFQKIDFTMNLCSQHHN